MCNRYETIVVLVVFKWRVEVRRLQIAHGPSSHQTACWSGSQRCGLLLGGRSVRSEVHSSSIFPGIVARRASSVSVVHSPKDPLGEPRVCTQKNVLSEGGV